MEETEPVFKRATPEELGERRRIDKEDIESSFKITTPKHSPSEVARKLNDEDGHKVTPSAIRKWDRLILSRVTKKVRESGSTRKYSPKDLALFNMIAVMRNLGYRIDDVKNILEIILNRTEDEREASSQRVRDAKKQLEGHLGKQIDALEKMLVVLKSVTKQ